MAEETIEPGNSQDFINNELKFDVDPDDPLTKASLQDHAQDEWIDILGNKELRKKVLKAGESGTRPQRSDLCVLSITGKLEDGTIVDNHENLQIQLGDVEVVQGLDLAVALMDVGETAEVEVASRFAYGSLGRKADIPPNAFINYIVELKSVEQEDEVESMGVSQRKELGNKKRERGNWWIQRDEPILAIQSYRRALEYLTPTKNMIGQEDEIEETMSDADLQNLLEDRMKVYNNLALAQIKTEAYDVALESVENVLRCQPQNGKALFRKGKILHLKGQHSAAYSTLQQALKISPRDKAIQQELTILKKKSEKDAENEKNLYRKMLGTKRSGKGDVSCKSKDEMRRSANVKVAWSILGGTAVAVIGLFAYRFISK